MALKTNSRWDEEFHLKNADGSNFDLTGKSLAMGLTEELNSNTMDVLFQTSDSTLVIDADPTTGKFKMNVPYSTTKNLTRGEYYFDVVELLPANDQLELLSGKLLVQQGITQLPIP